MKILFFMEFINYKNCKLILNFKIKQYQNISFKNQYIYTFLTALLYYFFYKNENENKNRKENHKKVFGMIRKK